MAERVDVAVVGGGLMGAAAAWAAARRGLSVSLHEQFEPGHVRGSSHGSARIVRRGYSDALYTRISGEAFELWREVELAADVRLLRMVGGLDHGPTRTAQVARLLAAAGVPHEVLAAADAEARWPGMRFAGPVVYHPQAGTMDADRAVSRVPRPGPARRRHDRARQSASPLSREPADDQRGRAARRRPGARGAVRRRRRRWLGRATARRPAHPPTDDGHPAAGLPLPAPRRVRAALAVGDPSGRDGGLPPARRSGRRAGRRPEGRRAH